MSPRAPVHKEHAWGRQSTSLSRESQGHCLGACVEGLENAERCLRPRVGDEDAGLSRVWIDLPYEVGGGYVSCLTGAARKTKSTRLQHVDDRVWNIACRKTYGGPYDLFKLVGADRGQYQSLLGDIVANPFQTYSSHSHERCRFFTGEQIRYRVVFGHNESPHLSPGCVDFAHHDRGDIVVGDEHDP